MYTSLPKFRKPFVSGNEPVYEDSHWYIATEHFDNQRFRLSIIELLNYVNKDLLAGKDTNQDIEIVRYHGSAEINLKITGEQFSIRAPFLRIDKANKVALMRRVAEVNFHPFTLVQIVLHEDVLWFEYECPIELCQPNKIYDVIRETCEYADTFDDEFIKKFGASFYREPKVTNLSEMDKESAWLHIKELGNDFTNYLTWYEQKRWDNAQWHLIAIHLLNLANLAYLNGYLKTEVENALYQHFHGEEDYYARMAKSKALVKRVTQEMSKDELVKNLYHIEKLMSLKWRGSLNDLQKFFTGHQKRIADYMNAGHFFDAAYDMTVVFMKAIHDYNVEKEYKDLILNTLLQTGGMEVDQAANVLYPVFNQFISGVFVTIPANLENMVSGFFSKLFK